MTIEMSCADPVHALGVSPGFMRDGIGFAARESGLYRLTDGGDRWTLVLDVERQCAAHAVTCVTFAPTGSGSEHLFAGTFGGVMYSRDGGWTWRVAVLPPPSPLVSCLSVSPAFAEDGVVFAGTIEDGIVQSSDRGESWRRWNFGLLDLSVLAIALSPAFVTDETLFAGTETGLYVSTNGGRAWKDTGFPEDAAPVLALAASPRFLDDGVVWAGTESRGLWRSEDGGATWARIDGGRVDDAVNQLVVAPLDRGDLLVALPAIAMLTRNGGVDWTLVARETGGGGIAAIAVPAGLDPGAPLLLARRDGVLRLLTITDE